nr:sigma factor [uncultured Blautia sp.]
MELEEVYDRIYRYCYFHTGRKELAEDLTQETFLRFFHRNPSLQRKFPCLFWRLWLCFVLPE